MSAAVTVDRRPVRPGGLLALLAATVAVGLVADAPVQLLALGIEVAGLAALALGLALARRDAPLAGGAVALVGGGVVAAALVAGATLGTRLTVAVELLPGMVGLAALAAGVVAIRPGWERRLVAFGAAVLVVGILASGVVHGSGGAILLAALVLAVVAWDAAEQAINLGEQVGRAARTGAVTLVHVAGSAAVGAAGALLVAVVYGVGVTGLPLVGLALLLVGVLALAVALER